MSSPTSNSFDFTSFIHPEANRLTTEFNQLRVRVEAVAKSAPNDREELFQEKEEWLREWRDVTSKMAKCREDMMTYNIGFTFTAEEVTMGNETIELAKLYAGQVSAMKRRAEEQAAEAARVAAAAAAEKELAKEKGKEKAKDTDDPMDGEGTGGGDADGEGEAEGDELEEQPAPPRKGRAAVQTKARMSVKTKTVFHDRACVRCAAKEIKCYGIPGHCCNACKDAKSGCIHSDRKAARKAKVAARAPSTTGTAGTSKSAAKA
ncbi:hypothetical protein P692DRAFT_20879727, partial [Suillus brevipes Sb2]